VKLDQIECVGFEIGETALDKRGEIVPVVSLGDVGIETAAHFGRDVDLFAKVATESRQQTLAAAVAIAVCRVEEVNPKLRARCKAARDSVSSTGPQVPPIAQHPKLTVDTFHPVLPSSRYCISFFLLEIS
jgi:glutamine amidotransferase PdxT